MQRVWIKVRLRTCLLFLGGFVFTIYVTNICYWLALGKVPPSLFQLFTHLPCPTTGCTRSLRALMQGDVGTSLLWNPFTLVFLALFTYSVLTLVNDYRKKRVLSLTRGIGIAWLLTLTVAWIFKLCQDPQWW